MSVTILRANALALPLADSSVDLVVTSPPYFGLRSYQDCGEHYEGQIGSEATPAEFIDALIAATREMVRVLKPSGSIFVNLGDKYAGTGGGGKGSSDGATGRASRPPRHNVGIPTKSLMGIPWRYAIRCIDELGLILRAEVIWCLSGGARVYARTPSGDRPVMLRDLARAYQPADVKLWNGEKWTQVLGWNKTPDAATEGALEFELRTGERIGCTPGHKWPTQRGVVRADEVLAGDVIATTRLPQPDVPHEPGLLPADDIGWLVGLYIAEGSRSGTTVQIAGHAKEDERHAHLSRIAAALGGSCHVYQTGENTVTANLRGSVIIGVLDQYVSRGTAKTKRLRKAAWQRSDEFLAAVVRGYLSGDGHHDSANNRWRLGFCANDEWAADLRTLAARLDAKLSLRRGQHIGQFGTFPGWRGEWRWTRSTHHNAKQDGEVVAIRKSRARDFYDLGVADDPHLFALASGVLTHNSKPNGMPESVTDRVRRSHETWFHFVKEPRYYSAVDEIREPHQHPHIAHTGPRVGRGEVDGNAQHLRMGLSPLGKLPGSVWTIATEPLRVPDELGVDHFAAFPTEWPRRIIQGWSPREVCTACGEGRRPVAVQERTSNDALRPAYGAGNHGTGGSTLGPRNVVAHITGYACACPDTSAPATPGVVLDPFGGTGTTALVADVLGRNGITVDLSADYCRLAEWRTTDPKQRAKAARVEAAEPVPEDQLSLFEEST